MATYPSWVYNQVAVSPQPAFIITSDAQLTALGSTWAVTPYPPTTTTAPYDLGFVVLDTRMQQLLVEARMQNLMLHDALLPGSLTADDLTRLRAEVLALDSAITT